MARARTGFLVASAVSVLVAGAGVARANGFDFPEVGARALGRGGASVASADDPLALYLNPAALSLLPNPQIMLSSHVGFLSWCMQRSGSYGDPASWPSSDHQVTVFDPEGTDPNFSGRWVYGSDSLPGGEADRPGGFPRVCNDGPPVISPQLVFGMPITPRLGFAFGVIAPSAAGHVVWGDASHDDTRFGTVPDPMRGDATYGTANGLVPSPVRYGLVEQFPIVLYPTIGAGFAITPRLRVGLAFSWGIASATFRNFTRPRAGADPGLDIRTTLTATDFFVPVIVGSVMFTPIETARGHTLDLALWGRWSDHIQGSGDLTLDSYWYSRTPMGASSPNPSGDQTKVFPDTQMTVPQASEVRFAVRYSNRIAPRPQDAAAVERLSQRVEDDMANTRFDIEAVAGYQLNGMVDDLVVDIPGDASALNFPGVGAIPPRLPIPHRWHDTITLRLGGDWNVLPGLAALRAGVSFESGAMNKQYLMVDFPAFQRLGVHVGLGIRLGHFDLALAYAHFFQQSLTASPTEAQGQQTVAVTPGYVVTGGTATSHMDIMSVQVLYNFR